MLNRARDAGFDAPVAAGQAALHKGAIHLGELGLDPLVLPAIGKFGLQRLADAPPLRDREPGDGGQPRVVGRQRVVLPIVHDQQQIGAVLQRIEIAGVAQIIPDIERQPSAAHAVSFRIFRSEAYAARSRPPGPCAGAVTGRGLLSAPCRPSGRYAMRQWPTQYSRR
jgi:hypothetical protein